MNNDERALLRDQCDVLSRAVAVLKTPYFTKNWEDTSRQIRDRLEIVLGNERMLEDLRHRKDEK